MLNFIPKILHQTPECSCFDCWQKRAAAKDEFQFMPFIVCSICGNKRCPHATNHLLQCTNSNEPGQKGSRYE